MTSTNDIDPNPKREGTTLQLVLRRCATQVVASVALVLGPVRIHPVIRPVWASKKVAMMVVALGLLFLFGMVFVDAPVTEAASHLPRWITLFFDIITDFGKSEWFLWPLAISFLALAALAPTLPHFSRLVLATMMVRVGFLFVAIGVPGLFVTTIKRVIGRARPLVNGHIDPFAFNPFAWHAAYASLPSGHATTAFSVFIALGALWPRGRAVLLIYALLIAASRVIVMAHYTTDVVTGAFVGVVGALMVQRWFALRRLGFSVGADGRLHRYSGPSRKRIKSVARSLLAE